MTRLNNIYTGLPSSFRPTNKPYCLVKDRTFEVLDGHLGWYPKILYRFIDQLDAMLSHCRCVMVVRMDLHMGGYTDANKVMAIFRRRLLKKLKSKYVDLKLGYLWVREVERAKTQHYHVALMVDKDLIHYSYQITQAVVDVWKNMTNIQPHIPKHCYYTVKCGALDTYAELIKRISYLAKKRGKGYRASQAKDFGSSRITARLSIN